MIKDRLDKYFREKEAAIIFGIMILILLFFIIGTVSVFKSQGRGYGEAPDSANTITAQLSEPGTSL